jgi:transposase InsO family protein
MNAHAERFNRTIQESFVDYHEELLFTDLALFNCKLADWLVFYNAERPHHSLGQQSPLSFLLQHQPECQRYWTHTVSDCGWCYNIT